MADSPAGLTDAEVAERAARGERNVAPAAAARRTRDIVRDNVVTVFNLTLFGTLAGTLALGLSTPATRRIVLGDTLFAGGSVVLNMVVGIVQELRAKRALDRIAALSRRRARVRRHGGTVEVDADAIVRDDLVVLAPGDRVPIDGPLVEGRGLEMDESLLTGESDAVAKRPGDRVYSGSFCVAGAGLVRAEDVGAASYASRLTLTARAVRNPLTPLERNINFVIQCLVALMVVVAALQIVAASNAGVGPVDALRFTLVIVTSFVPAGLVLAITVSLTAAAVRVGRHGTLVQRLSAVESMGNLTVLCVDKTGTLTRNLLVVERIEPVDGLTGPAVTERLAAYAAAVSTPNRTLQAIRARVGAPATAWRPVAEVGFSSARKWSALTLVSETGAAETLALGSPDTLLDAADPAHAALLARVEALTREGARVVMLATVPGGSLDESPGAERIAGALVPSALIVIHDEIRADIAATIAALAAGGVEVKIISGDHPRTVSSVAARAGIPTTPLLTESELAALTGGGFEAAVRGGAIFARTTPAMKRRIVAALARQGQYVAMVGDGINDVPALKEARLAVAMNDGAQIAKDVSDLVLLDNTLSALPRALLEGRAITQKIYASARLYLTRNAMTVLAIVLAGFAGLPFPAEPRQISWNATVGVVLPCAFLAFDVIRPAHMRSFARGVLGYGVLAGVIGGVIVVAATVVAHEVDPRVGHTRTVFALANLHFALHVFLDTHGVSVFSPASLRMRPGVTALAGALLAVGVALPQLAPRLFNAEPLSVTGWLLVLGLPVVGRLLLRLYGPFVRGMERALGRRGLILAGLALGSLGATGVATAEVQRLVVTTRQDVLGGDYEKLGGTVELELDPGHPANAVIVDLERAPRNARGRVEASADFMVLRPRRPPPRGSTALLEVSNRGGKALLPYFNRAAWTGDPTTDADFGDRLLMRLNLTLVWVGWQFDVPPRADLLRLRAPIARGADGPLLGLVRSDWTVDRPTAVLPLAHRGHVAYPVADARHPDNVLTVRSARLGPREVVPRDRWRFARAEGGRLVDDPRHVHLSDGFQPGKIYELVYRAQDPAVVGIGLAAVRDVVSWARHDPRSPFPVNGAIAVGISQSGRFLRHFLYQGFNTDEAGRKVFDGMLVHTAGAGRGSFNHRFAQPSRDAHRFSAFFYPTDLFPFTTRSQTDPDTGITDGLQAASAARPDHWPKTFFTNTGYEYWGRAASLVHTSPDGRADVPPLPSERIYHLAGGQHFVGAFPPPPSGLAGGAYRDNPLDFLVTMRALLVRLVEWVVDDRTPPASAYPTLGAGTLVPIGALAFPRTPGVTPPAVIHQAHRVDYGPRWKAGIITREPPGIGAPFPALVSQVDADGNEAAGVRGVELLAPLATYTPWQLRGGGGSDAVELVDFLGTYAPLPRTEAERQRTGDGRLSLERRYADRRAYLAAAARGAQSLVGAGLLLREDVARVLERAEQHWDWVMRR